MTALDPRTPYAEQSAARIARGLTFLVVGSALPWAAAALGLAGDLVFFLFALGILIVLTGLIQLISGIRAYASNADLVAQHAGYQLALATARAESPPGQGARAVR